MPLKIVQKSEAAKTWGVDRSMVTKYVRRGMPVRSDGRLDWAVVDGWRQENIISRRSGSYKSRQPPHRWTGVDVIRLLHRDGVAKLLIVTKALGLNGAQTYASVYALLAWLWVTCGDALMLECGPNGPAVNYATVESEEAISEEQRSEVEALLLKVDEALALKSEVGR